MWIFFSPALKCHASSTEHHWGDAAETDETGENEPGCAKRLYDVHLCCIWQVLGGSVVKTDYTVPLQYYTVFVACLVNPWQCRGLSTRWAHSLGGIKLTICVWLSGCVGYVLTAGTQDQFWIAAYIWCSWITVSGYSRMQPRPAATECSMKRMTRETCRVFALTHALYDFCTVWWCSQWHTTHQVCDFGEMCIWLL